LIRRALSELSGGLGDSGLLIPIAVALITVNGLDATAVFAGVGALYVGTALYFRVPVPVQPLKAFAAAAIALQLDPATIALGALLMTAAMWTLALSGLAGRIADRFPLVLVRGVQVSVALLLAKAAVELAERGNWEGLPAIDPAVSFWMAVAVCVALIVSRSRLRLPGTLLVLVAGAGVGIAVGGLPGPLALGPGQPEIALPEGGDLGTALTALVLAQIPLTFGNSVVATADVEREYFGARAARVTPDRLAGSIGVGNLFAGLAGGLPVCHGAGGVTAHYKLGARTAWATGSAGVLFLTLAIVLGSSLPTLLTAIAPGALAGMLLFVAIEHGLLGARLERLDDRLIAAGVGLVTLISGNLGIGFAAGVVAMILREGARRADLRGRGFPWPAGQSRV
jgi:MFS superfamily sulfate permease-like transporter